MNAHPLSCPFCGRNPQGCQNSTISNFGLLSDFAYGCKDCDFTIFPGPSEANRAPDATIARWNALVEKIAGRQGRRADGHAQDRPVQISVSINNGYGIFSAMYIDGRIANIDRKGKIFPEIEYSAYVAINAARDFIDNVLGDEEPTKDQEGGIGE